jgi:hypothetical protein
MPELLIGNRALMKRLRKLEHNRFLMGFVLLLALMKSAMVLFADVDDDPVTTRVEFSATDVSAREAANSMRQEEQLTSHSVSALIEAKDDAHWHSFYRSSASIDSAAVAAHAPLRC